MTSYEDRNEGRRSPTIETIVCQGEHAVLILHSAVFGRKEGTMRRFRVHKVKPYAQHAVAVRIHYVEPRKRSWDSTAITPTNHCYATIERDGEVIFDSRDHVPIDMHAWQRARAEFPDRTPSA